MDFDFSDDQYLFRDSVRAFLTDRFPGPKPGAPLPTADAVDLLWAGLAELGVFSMLVPEEFGGMGLSFVDLALILEEFGRFLTPPSVVDTLVATDTLVRFGRPAQKAALLPGISRGRLRLAVAASEAGAGYGLQELATTVEDGVLCGTKILVANAAAADGVLVAALAGNPPGAKLLLVQPSREGIGMRRHETLDPSCTYMELSFDQVTVSAEDFVAGANDGAARRTMDASALSAAAVMTGIAGAVFDATVEYVKQRHQFGKPLGSFQAVKHRCADMMVALDSSRSAAYYAAWALANESSDRAKAVSVAKSFCGDAARLICGQGTQLHGGMGFTWELGLHFHLRRATLLEYAYGNAIFHRRRVLDESLAELRVGG